MSLDASAILYAQTMLGKGYGFQNAARIANVNECDLREFVGAVKQRPSPTPWTPAKPRRGRVPANVRAQAAMSLSGPSRVIIHAVATQYGLTTADMIGPRASRFVSFARHEAMFRVRHERNLSLPSIGRIFGGRDHTTVLHGIRCHEARMAWAEALIAAGNPDAYQADLFARAA